MPVSLAVGDARQALPRDADIVFLTAMPPVYARSPAPAARPLRPHPTRCLPREDAERADRQACCMAGTPPARRFHRRHGASIFIRCANMSTDCLLAASDAGLRNSPLRACGRWTASPRSTTGHEAASMIGAHFTRSQRSSKPHCVKSSRISGRPSLRRATGVEARCIEDRGRADAERDRLRLLRMIDGTAFETARAVLPRVVDRALQQTVAEAFAHAAVRAERNS